MYQLSAKLAQNYHVTALVVCLSVWKLSCLIWNCRLYTVKSVKYTIPYIYLHLSLLGGGMPDPPGVLHGELTGGVDNVTGGSTPPIWIFRGWAYQHILGYWVPYDVMTDLIKTWIKAI